MEELAECSATPGFHVALDFAQQGKNDSCRSWVLYCIAIFKFHVVTLCTIYLHVETPPPGRTWRGRLSSRVIHSQNGDHLFLLETTPKF